MLKDRGPFRRAVLKQYISQMSKPDPRGIFDDFVAEVLEQQGFSWEEDPRSVYDPKQLWTSLERYATSWDKFEFMDKHMKLGFAKAFKIFGNPNRGRYLSVLDSEELIGSIKLSKSSGLPLMTSKLKSLSYSLDRESQIRAGKKAPNPCVAYKRTQRNNKTRLVWGYPLEMTLMEARFARPLIDYFKSNSTPMAFGITKMELGARINRYFEEAGGTTVCLDFSKFDQTIPALFIREAFRILSSWFSPEDREELGWTIVREYFVNTPIVMPDGHLYTGKNHGVPSGSYFTQLIDSIVNVACMYALSSSCKMTFEDRSLLVLGDDVMVQVRGDIKLTMYSAYLSKFGLVLHGEEKTVIGKCHFLGATWERGKPKKDLQELVNSAVFPETFRNYGGDIVTGVDAVLRSYASNYVNAISLVPSRSHHLMSMAGKDYDPVVNRRNDLNSKFMSGSDRFQFDYFGNTEELRSDVIGAPLSLRILL